MVDGFGGFKSFYHKYKSQILLSQLGMQGGIAPPLSKLTYSHPPFRENNKTKNFKRIMLKVTYIQSRLKDWPLNKWELSNVKIFVFNYLISLLWNWVVCANDKHYKGDIRIISPYISRRWRWLRWQPIKKFVCFEAMWSRWRGATEVGCSVGRPMAKNALNGRFPEIGSSFYSYFILLFREQIFCFVQLFKGGWIGRKIEVEAEVWEKRDGG